jgi:uncharacterized membrane protein YbhN (UPF0104 family)
MKILYRILIYLSLLFLLIYLYRFDYLHIQGLRLDLYYLIPASLLLWAGFMMSTISWWKALAAHGISVSPKNALVSHGLSVFAKYIPGKVWVILGRASFVSLGSHSMRDASYISLKEQLIYVWLGLVIGIGPMLYFYPLNAFVILVLALAVLFTFFLYSRTFHRLVISLLSRILRRDLHVPLVSLHEVLPVILYVLTYWSLWMLAFFFFIKAFHYDFSVAVVFSWPLSISLGVLALITPGGIGVREGILVGFMLLTGMQLEEATTIAVISRLWFISGEIFIFVISLVLNKFSLRPRLS